MSEMQTAAPDLREVGQIHIDTCGVCTREIYGSRASVRNPRIVHCSVCEAAVCRDCEEKLMTCAESYCVRMNLCPSCVTWGTDEEPRCHSCADQVKKHPTNGEGSTQGETAIESIALTGTESVKSPVLPPMGSNSPEREAYRKMIARCYNPNVESFKNYGARGIRVCQTWIDSYLNFITDMRSRPSAEYSLERIDNNGDYTPGNCIWATRAQQNRNKRSNRVIEFDGRSLTVTEWAKELGLHYSTLIVRIKSGWPIDQVLSKADHRREISGSPTLGSQRPHLSYEQSLIEHQARVRRSWDLPRVSSIVLPSRPSMNPRNRPDGEAA